MKRPIGPYEWCALTQEMLNEERENAPHTGWIKPVYNAMLEVADCLTEPVWAVITEGHKRLRERHSDAIEWEDKLREDSDEAE